MAEPSVYDHIVAALRKKANPDNANLKPADMRLRGYQLHVQEAKAMGETPQPYEQWIKSQE